MAIMKKLKKKNNKFGLIVNDAGLEGGSEEPDEQKRNTDITRRKKSL